MELFFFSFLFFRLIHLCYCELKQIVLPDSSFFWYQIHGVLNVVSWGILFPTGAIIARYLRTFESADPAWFYLHVFCQVSAYAIGVAGWGTGLKLGSESEGIQFNGHRNIGISLFCLATIQVMLFRKFDLCYLVFLAEFVHFPKSVLNNVVSVCCCFFTN